MQDHLLSVESIRSGYVGSKVLNELSLTLDAGEILAIIGRNGVGKTTLMRTSRFTKAILPGPMPFESLILLTTNWTFHQALDCCMQGYILRDRLFWLMTIAV